MYGKYISTIIVTMIIEILYSQQLLAANITSQCMLGVPIYNRQLVQGDNNQLPITINAEYAKGDYPGQIIFIGNVSIDQGNSRFRADEVQLHHHQIHPEEGATKLVQTVNALGNVHYDDNHILMEGSKGWVNLNTKDINIWDGDYQIVGRQGRGKAAIMKQRSKNRYTVLKNGSFTSCLSGSNIWSVGGHEMIYDREEQVVKIWNASFKLGQVPIFYSPYLQLPVGDKRRSGFLIMNTKYSTPNYFEFYSPFYWNIAPNIDATIIPHYIHKRDNVMWENEVRYLTSAGTGLMELDYLSSDKVFKDERSADGEHCRWLFYWQHVGVLDQVWRFNIDYTKVSDPYYFNDFDSKYGSSTDDYTKQKFSAGYAGDSFDATLATKQFQVFNRESSRRYAAAKPQIDINWHQKFGPFDTNVYAQVVHFINNSDMLKSTRLHLEPSINLPLMNNWGRLNTEAKLMATHYQQKNSEWYNSTYGTDLKDSVNRVLPHFKMDGKLVFEREIKQAEGYTQTLEPRMQYLYVPYRYQSKIQNYDSSLLLQQSDYDVLFRDRLYGGLDRIASANQLTNGVTTRIYDDAAVERFNFSVGEIYFFKKSHDDDANWWWVKGKDKEKIGLLIWAGDVYWRMTDRFGLKGGLQYSTRSSVATSSSAIEYRRDEDRMVQLTYRYSSPEYIHDTLPEYVSTKQYREGVSQVGSAASWLIADRWYITGAYYFDTNTSKIADQMVGIQYNSCCYAIRVGYERRLTGNTDSGDQSKYDTVISFNIELRGLSSNYGLNNQQILRSNLLPYRSLFMTQST